MTSDDRQRMNVRAIRVTLASALRYLPPEKVHPCIARARQLLDHARQEATAASVLADIGALDSELRSMSEVARQQES